MKKIQNVQQISYVLIGINESKREMQAIVVFLLLGLIHS